MSSLVYKFLNPVVKTILRSPLHGLMSKNTLILQYTGAKSGRVYSLPVSYVRIGQDIFCFTGRTNKWWRNLRGGKPVRLVLAGKRVDAIASVESDDESQIADTLGTFLRASPRDAGPSNVRLDRDKNPDPGDVAQAAKNLVRIQMSV